MASLTGTKIKDTYDGLLKTTDNGVLGASAKLITDGLGNSSGLYLGTTGNVGIGVSPNYNLTSYKGGANANYIQVANGSTGAGSANGTLFGVDASGNGTINVQGVFNLITTVAGVERMRIDSSGNVGFADSNPLNLISLRGYGALDSNANQGFTLSSNHYYSSGDKYIGNGYAGVISHDTNGGAAGSFVFKNSSNNTSGAGASMTLTERMRITSGGSLYVNRTSGLNSQHAIQGDTSDAGTAAITVYNQNTSDSSPALNAIKNSGTTTSSARFIQFYSDGGSQPMGGIVGNGAENVQFLTLSDEREKENIVEISGSLDKIMQLQVSEFDWKKTGEHINAGFIAQNVETVFPEYVVENAANEGQEARKGITGGMSAGYVAHLTKAIQELKAEIELLKSQING